MSSPRALDREALSQFFFDSLALSAWKRYGDSRWALRCNPSSGNLHPTEAYYLGPPVVGVSARAIVAHYAPREHGLEIRAQLDDAALRALVGAHGGFLIGLSSIHWREAWKYGERAFRYCQHDVGHALGALAVAAAGLGWRARVLEEPSSAELAELLGIAEQSGPEAEHPDVLVAVTCAGSHAPNGIEQRPLALPPSSMRWTGRPNELSPAHLDWPAIEVAAAATRKERSSPGVEPAASPTALFAPRAPGSSSHTLRALVRKRRSAMAFDGRTRMSREAFVGLLRRTLPRADETVVSAWPFEPAVDLVLFVQRVEGLAPGLYLAVRDPRRESRLRAAFDARFEWQREDAGELPLFRLRAGDVRSLARGVSCHQDIAADGCFSLGMLASFRDTLERGGAWHYRGLLWECGLIGQILYLEAEAVGLRGTGIGCFFDDAVHRTLGLAHREFQSLYHFTVGAAVDDPRLESEPAYAESPVG